MVIILLSRLHCLPVFPLPTPLLLVYILTCTCYIASTPEVMQLSPWRSRWPVHEFVVHRSSDHQALGIRYHHVSMMNQLQASLTHISAHLFTLLCATNISHLNIFLWFGAMKDNYD